MPEPAFETTTERTYDRLPEFYRDADEVEPSGGGWPLKRYLSLTADQAAEVEALLDRFIYIPPEDGGEPADTSDLVDPATADAGWLAWLAQLVGVDLSQLPDEAAQRDAIEFGSTGWRAGTKSAVASAARTVLTGTKYAAVYDHRTDVGAGGAWDVLIVTRPTETPGGADVIAAVVAKRAKPAGVTLYWLAYEASWDTLEAAYPTSDDWDATGSWDALQETGL